MTYWRHRDHRGRHHLVHAAVVPIDVAGHEADDILLGNDTDSAALVHHQRRQGIGISHAADDESRIAAHGCARQIRLDRETVRSGIMGTAVA